ncbi:(2Fe-2S)-binding protein [Spongiibacter taiwanensis]|uniref:2Fe-2S iron-sulfur cluster-binding protein n=1 Tax=Spongiibacter taiwanensis TaxID=1748242 RepID=UPI0020352D03|nr:2Fe-2S iron-sulfur cluster-binding protein [Spongiibacter taiwanensis]USA42659.1 (2Fe-2S)-binding protein [Spongiibacter taiwanensis]
MTVLIFENASGEQTRVEATAGNSVMETALAAGVDGILADCGGGCSCATCHCYVDPGIFPEADGIEREMLECVLNPQPRSRLSCQLVVSEAMGEVVIQLPESQI